MKLLRFMFAALAGILLNFPALAGHLEGVVTLVKDDLAAVDKIRATPERHAMLYFGDHLN